MRWLLGAIGVLLCLSVAEAGKIWSPACSEATAVLRDAQLEVVKKRQHLQRVKTWRQAAPNRSAACSPSLRGFDGERAWCIRHRSTDSLVLREIARARQELERAIMDFLDEFHDVQRHCLADGVR